MASHLDLEEQEQLDQLKHFWNRYGNAISWVLIVIFGGFAAWNGYQYWQRSLAAQALADKGNADAAKAALNWVLEQSGDDGVKAVARLRLAALQVDAKAYDEALKTLGTAFPAEFEALAADRKGDVLALQGKADEAVAEYRKAYQKLDERTEYRRLIEAKLNALGVNPQAGTEPATAPTEDKK